MDGEKGWDLNTEPLISGTYEAMMPPSSTALC